LLRRRARADGLDRRQLNQRIRHAKLNAPVA
jgi:hypothetical protein